MVISVNTWRALSDAAHLYRWSIRIFEWVPNSRWIGYRESFDSDLLT